MLSPLEQFVVVPFPYWSNFHYTLGVLTSSLALGFATHTQSNRLVFTRMRLIFGGFFDFLSGLVRENFMTRSFLFFPFIFLLFGFLVGANLVGMVPYSFAITSHIAITLFFSSLAFFLAVATGIYSHGVHFFGLFLPPGAPFLLIPFLVVIEVISYVARLFSLAIRLFANIMSGHTLLKILAGFCWTLGVASSGLTLVPFVVVLVVSALEIVIAFLQAYVFSILTCIYLNEALVLH